MLEKGDIQPRLTFRSIQVLRGLAAASVVLFHTNGLVNSEKYWNTVFLNACFGSGYAGVDIFFVLSGFIIFFVHRNDLGKPSHLKDYLLKRFTRVYPIYWAVLVLMAVSSLLRGQIRVFDLTFLGFLQNLTLMPSINEPYVGVSWTLSHEIYFYALFALVILRRRLGSIVAAGVVSTSATLFVCGIQLPFPLSFVFSRFNLEFAMGVAAAVLAQRINVDALKSRALAAGGTIFLIFMAIADARWTNSDTRESFRLFYGLGAFFVVLGLVLLEKNRELRPPRLLQLLGDGSYSIYLLHFPVVALSAQLLKKLVIDRPLGPQLSGLVVASAGLLAGCILHLYFERPLTRFLRMRTRGAAKI